MNRIGNMMALFLGITFFVLMFVGHAAAQMTSPQLLISAAPGLPEGTLVNGPFIVAINGVALAEPMPAVVTNTALWSGHCQDPIFCTRYYESIGSSSRVNVSSQWERSNAIASSGKEVTDPWVESVCAAANSTGVR